MRWQGAQRWQGERRLADHNVTCDVQRQL